jgi:hypothetical protein
MRWAGHVVCLVEKRSACKVLVGKHKEQRLPAKPRCRWEDDIKGELEEIRRDGMDCINLAENRIGGRLLDMW